MSDQIQKLQQFANEELGIPPEKPLVMVPGGGVQIRDTAREIYQLAAAKEGLFYSNGIVMKLRRIRGQLPTLSFIEPALARSEFEKYCRFRKGQKDKEQLCALPESDAKAILLCDNAEEFLPNVTGLLNRPMPVLHNGQIEMLHAGYNQNTGLLVAEGSIIEPDSLEEAVNMIESILVDFQFQTESDKSRAIALILTPALKMGGFISDRIPVHIIEANDSQTGKGTLLEFHKLIYGEEPIVVALQKGGVGSLDEKFAEALVSGRPFIQFDNFRGELNSPLLEAFLTNPSTLYVRTPYSKSHPIDGSLRVVTITSNDMSVTEDLANRASFIRLEKLPDREFITYNGMGMKELIKLTQPNLMGAITKIIRRYHELGMPETMEKRHDAREWTRKLDWIVQNIFHLAPLMDGMIEIKQRAQNPSLTFVRALAIQVEKAERLDEDLFAQELADICEPAGLDIPGLNKKGADGYTEKQEAQRIGQLMGQAFDGTNSIQVDQYRVSRGKLLRRNHEGNTWTGNHYTFERVGAKTAQEQEVDANI